MRHLSIVIPVYGCADCLRPLTERLVNAASEITESFEILYVDDRSPDGSWERILGIAAEEPRVRAIRLSRNFGQHAAITAGLAHCRGEWTVVMDCDLQDPPEAIPAMYREAQTGRDVVLTKRVARQQNSFRRIARRGYFRLRNIFFKTDMDSEYHARLVLARPLDKVPPWLGAVYSNGYFDLYGIRDGTCSTAGIRPVAARPSP